ncbi:MAG: adenine deaminase [Gaiellales bacterium]|nr:adenine deaminase [Gaiellales bacterium]
MGEATSGSDLYDSIPKVELHCHVEGSVRPQTVADLARKAGRAFPVEDPTELYRFSSLDSFLAIFWMVQETLVEPGDWERIAYESLVDAAPHGLRYREMFFTPARHLAAGQALAGIIDGLTAGIEAAERDTGVQCRLIADMDRAYGPAAGLELVEQFAELRQRGGAERVIGVGMDSTELGVDLAAFAEPFELARRHGFRSTGHAGEAVGVGAQNIVIGLEVLGLERIDHGIAVVDDPALMRRMAADRVPLTVCPSSNVVIANRFPSLREHPFRRMREAGLLVTLNTDDPAMTDLDLGREYRYVAEAQGLEFDDLAAIALDGIEASWLDDVDRRVMRAEFSQALAGLRPRAPTQ